MRFLIDWCFVRTRSCSCHMSHVPVIFLHFVKIHTDARSGLCNNERPAISSTSHHLCSRITTFSSLQSISSTIRDFFVLLQLQKKPSQCEQHYLTINTSEKKRIHWKIRLNLLILNPKGRPMRFTTLSSLHFSHSCQKSRFCRFFRQSLFFLLCIYRLVTQILPIVKFIYFHQFSQQYKWISTFWQT